MIKYFLKDNFCLFIYNFSQRFGCISQRAGCKKTARCESRISQSDCFILMDKNKLYLLLDEKPGYNNFYLYISPYACIYH